MINEEKQNINGFVSSVAKTVSGATVFDPFKTCKSCKYM